MAIILSLSASPVLCSLATLIVCHQLYRILLMVRNFLTIRHFNPNIPVVFAPTTWQDPIWIPLSPYFVWLPEHFPCILTNWISLTLLGWPTTDRGRAHVKYGEVFALVSPNRTEIFQRDPTASKEIAVKWKIWIKDPVLYGIFDTFGKNVNTVNFEDWQRHRKITGSTFRESTYAVVWDESRRQASQMMSEISGKSLTMKHVQEYIAILAMHILSKGAFGKQYDYGKGVDQRDPGHRMSYFEALAFIMQNILATILFSGLKLPHWMLLPFFKRLKTAVEEYRSYMEDALVEHSKTGLSDTKHDLATQLLYANQLAKDEHLSSGGKNYLSDDELYGNMFMFNMAGFETTAMSLGFTLPFLALAPELQDWAREEIMQDGGTGDYEVAYIGLKRCLAIMYETLRTYAAAANISRLGPDTPTELQLPRQNSSVIVPPRCIVSIPIQMLNHDERTWGADVDEYNPKRWIEVGADGKEELISDVDQVGYMVWSEGPRVCPGKKFSQVEFVAVLATILAGWDLRPAKLNNITSDAAAKEVLKKALLDVRPDISPKFKRPESCGIEFIAR